MLSTDSGNIALYDIEHPGTDNKRVQIIRQQGKDFRKEDEQAHTCYDASFICYHGSSKT